MVDAETQLVVLFHGFGPPESPQALARVLPLEKVDAVLAYVNLPLVADRLPAGGTDEVRRLQREDFVNGLFFRSISGAAGELGPIVAEVAAAYHLDRARGIGLFGFSAGGSAALLALMESDVPVAAAVIVNAPMSVEQNVENWERVLKMKFGWDDSSREAASRYDVGRHADQIAQREMLPALLLVQGDADESFSVERSREVSERLKSGYAARGARDQVQLEVVHNLSHNFGQPSDNASIGVEIDRMAEKWFQRFLATKLPGK